MNGENIEKSENDNVDGEHFIRFQLHCTRRGHRFFFFFFQVVISPLRCCDLYFWERGEQLRSCTKITFNYFITALFQDNF